CASRDVAQTQTDLLTFPYVLPDADNPPFYAQDPVHGSTYYGGPVMTGTVRVQIIAYAWSDLSVPVFLQDFLIALSGSPLANVLTTFADAAGNRPSGNFAVQPLIVRAYDPAIGSVINDADIVRLTGSSWDEITLYVLLPGPGFK